jgi:hypothetical protein
MNLHSVIYVDSDTVYQTFSEIQKQYPYGHRIMSSLFSVQFFFFNFEGWGETASIWYVGHYSIYCTSLG